MGLYTRMEIEEIVILQRLYLYTRGFSYGAKAIHRTLQQQGVQPLPSMATINRILSRNRLIYRRTGYYPEDYC
jgi:putative transposase